MSVDNANKRASFISMARPWRPTLPVRTSAFDTAPERAQLGFRYALDVSSTPLVAPVANIVPVRFVTGPANVVPVEIVTIYAPGVIYVKEYVGPANVVPIREAPSETPRVKVIVEV